MKKTTTTDASEIFPATDAVAHVEPAEPVKKARFSFTEKIQWRDPLRGVVGPTDMELADERAIGGLRNTAESVGRLSYSAAFGSKLGAAIRTTLQDDLDRFRVHGDVKASLGPSYVRCHRLGENTEHSTTCYSGGSGRIPAADCWSHALGCSHL